MPSIVTLSDGLVAVDLSTRDFEGFRSDVLDEGGLADLYTPNWTDRSELDLGVALTEVFAFFADNLAYYQDRCANEALFPSAVQRRSVLEHCQALGYTPQARVSATVGVTIVTNDSGTVLSKTQVRTPAYQGDTPKTFEFESDFVSTGAGTYTGVILYHGRTVEEVLGSSDGSPAQEFELGSTPLTNISDGSSGLRLWVNETGIPEWWTLVSSFLDSDPIDKHFMAFVGEDDRVTIKFGDGLHGKIPAVGVNNVGSTYLVGGGAEGNRVGIGTLTTISGNYPFIDSITNPLRPSGGMDKESISRIKVMAPNSLRAMDRALSHEDYATQAMRVPGVRTAMAQNGAGRFYEQVVVAAQGFNPVPSGEWDPYTRVGTGLIGAVGRYIIERGNTPVILEVLPAQPVDLNVVATAYLYERYFVKLEDIAREIEDIVREAFDINLIDFGDQVPMSKFYDIVEDIKGVDYVNLYRFQREPYAVQKDTAATPCDITISDFHVDESTENDIFSIRFLSPYSFRVESRNKGIQSNGSIDVPYWTSDGHFGFTIFSGTVSPTDVEKWEIITGAYRSNVDPVGSELTRLKDEAFMLTLAMSRNSRR